MPDSLLSILKLLLLALLYLFFFRVLRAVWAELKPQPVGAASSGSGVAAPAASHGRRGGGAPSPSTSLRVVAPAEAKGSTFAIGDEVTVGRAAGCGIALTSDSTVSQLHARVFRKEGRLYVEDLGSTNGTFVNGKPISRPTELRGRDRLQVGATVLELAR